MNELLERLTKATESIAETLEHERNDRKQRQQADELRRHGF